MEKAELLEKSRQNLEWFRDNFNQLQKEYDKQWVIIDNQGIVTSSSTYDQISKNLKDRKTALLEFVDSEQIAMFF
jgi:hypothetical protein